MPGFFENKIVWITGASSGIGEALAYELSKEGAVLILSSRNESALNRVTMNCQTSRENILVLPMDISNIPEIESKTLLAIEKWGRIDFLIHNAGIAARDMIEDTDLSVYRAVMETNYFGPVALTKAVLPSMIRAKNGHFIVIASLSAKFGVPKLSAYAGSKHALLGFFNSLRLESGKKGIRVSIVIPGFINTSILEKAVDGKGNISGKNLSVNEKGMSAEQCAVRILKAIKRGKQETLIGGSEIVSVYIHRFFPAIFNKVMANHPMKKLRQALPRFFK